MRMAVWPGTQPRGSSPILNLSLQRKGAAGKQALPFRRSKRLCHQASLPSGVQAPSVVEPLGRLFLLANKRNQVTSSCDYRLPSPQHNCINRPLFKYTLNSSQEPQTCPNLFRTECMPHPGGSLHRPSPKPVPNTTHHSSQEIAPCSSGTRPQWVEMPANPSCDKPTPLPFLFQVKGPAEARIHTILPSYKLPKSSAHSGVDASGMLRQHQTRLP